MLLNEADTRAQLIEPKLQAAGWTGSQIIREHFYRRDHRYTAGRIYLIGDEARRREPRRVDYLLCYTDIAFQIVWRLARSGWLNRLHQDRPGRVLFLADRVVLRDQAYNNFPPSPTAPATHALS